MNTSGDGLGAHKAGQDGHFLIRAERKRVSPATKHSTREKGTGSADKRHGRHNEDGETETSSVDFSQKSESRVNAVLVVILS